MIREEGIVRRVVAPGRVEVVIPETEACRGCRACQSAGQGCMSIEARDDMGAGPDDRVELAISTGGVVGTAFFVFLFPVLALLAGYGCGVALAGPWGWKSETAGVGAAFVFFLLSFAPIKWYERTVARTGAFSARVTRILGPPAEAPEQRTEGRWGS